MKKSLTFFLMMMCLVNIDLKAQTSFTVSKTTADYSAYKHIAIGQTWELTRIAHNDTYTGVFLSITITNNKEGMFTIPKDACIYGSFGTLYPVGLTIQDKEYELGEWWYYGAWNKGKKAEVIIYFPRIPAGVVSIDYREPRFITWENIPIVDNQDTAEKSGWSEATLRTYWAQNKCLKIEGIYYFTSASDRNWWGECKHALAVIKDDHQYKLIYLRGSNKNIWHEGDVKAVFIPTATRGLYKATSWLMENKMNNEDFYLKFGEGSMSIYESTSNITAEFLQLYPAVDENIDDISDSSIDSNQSGLSSVQDKTGSGIFVSNKIVVTNNHVVNNASKIEVVVKDGTNVSTYTAAILSKDTTNDLALLNIKDSGFNGIGELPFAISTRTSDVGTAIFTMGYPMATYMGEEVKITDGIINSKTGYDGDIVTYQISAPIQPGSSGGPLFDKDGNLIGITTAGIIGAQNVGYAIKGSYLCNLIESAPISINIPEKNNLSNMNLTEQIKCLSKYVVFIKVYH